MQYILNNLQDLDKVGKDIIGKLTASKVILLKGDMGAGKTTLVKALCKELNVLDLVNSPTFSLVNEYKSPQGPVYHFDFYRLERESEALDMGVEEYLYSGQYCFIEWPDKINNLLPECFYIIHILALSDSERKINISLESN